MSDAESRADGQEDAGVEVKRFHDQLGLLVVAVTAPRLGPRDGEDRQLEDDEPREL